MSAAALSQPIPPTLSRMWPGAGAGGNPGWGGGYQPPPTQFHPQQQWNQAPPPAIPPAGGPKKKAFICGINYIGE